MNMEKSHSDDLKKEMYTKINEVWKLAKKWLDNPPTTEEQIQEMCLDFNRLCADNRYDHFQRDVACAFYMELTRRWIDGT